jgi:hypothetical protein
MYSNHITIQAKTKSLKIKTAFALNPTLFIVGENGVQGYIQLAEKRGLQILKLYCYFRPDPS